KVGRWLAAEQPAIATPADWTRETCAAWVARVTRASVGDYAQRRVNLVGRVGRRLAPTTMASYISTTRTLLRDCQEWGWRARRVDPATALATPRSVRGMLGSKPRSSPTTPGPRSCGPGSISGLRISPSVVSAPTPSN